MDTTTAVTVIGKQVASQESLPPIGTGSTVEVSTPEQALQINEALRTLLFARFVFALCVASTIVVSFIDAEPLAQYIFYAGVGPGIPFFAFMAWILRNPEAYRPHHHTAFGMMCVWVMVCSYYYFGVFSPVLLMVPFGALIFSVSESLSSALLIMGSVIVSHLVVSLLLIFGVIPDYSLFGARKLSVGSQLGIMVLIDACFVAAFAVARSLRSQQHTSMVNLNATVRELAQREALLIEARQNLKRAQQVGGPGPYTGQTLGAFQLGSLLGRGGMGEIYEGIDLRSDTRCAVKLLHAQAMIRPGFFKRFLREAQLASTVNSPYVVRVLAIGDPNEEIPFIAMERLDGCDLAEYLQEHSVIEASELLELVRHISAGLEGARQVGIVHRDIKPHNLFRHQEGNRVTWKILDFGVSKPSTTTGTLTEGHVVGTPAYMAPEQAQGDDVDHRADIYGLAAIAYRCLTGHAPFEGRDLPLLLHRVVYSTPVRPSAFRNLPSGVDDALAVGLAKKADARFQTASEFCEAIAAGLRGERPVADRAAKILVDSPWSVDRLMDDIGAVQVGGR